ncbi:coagulation factor IIIa [Anguilla anguilla]|uniref:coagulation factor IIIa n=1 Tax=Anguilla anguilla TaxID=7936 RepID=UPI0015A8A787|nr:coagulation factor IIIa [Anguilla anguilla]
MTNMLDTRIYASLFCSLFILIGKISGTTFPEAQDVKWHSFDFKTLLMWGPKPTNYSYTVEFSVVGENRKRNPHCIKTMNTECDLTSMLTELKKTYSAVVQSEPLPGKTSDLVEFPYAKSEHFCPYKDTEIGKPTFSIEVSKDKCKITLHIKDPISAIYKDGRFLNMRDIFMNDLKYRVSYSKAQSSGKRTKDTDSNQIELEVDKGESYCFNVQTYIPSRVQAKQLGEQSSTQCSPAEDRPIYIEYSIGVIVGLIFLVIVIIAAIVGIAVFCKRRSSSRNHGKDDGL